MPINHATLKTEIDTDPASIGYAGKQNGEIQNLINAVGSATAPVERRRITAQEILAEVRQAEWYAMATAPDLQGEARMNLFHTLVSASTIADLNWEDTQIRNLIRSCFPATSAPNTRNGIIALEQVAATIASRSEQLFGHREFVTIDDVRIARALP